MKMYLIIKFYVTDEVMKKEVNQEIKQELIHDINIKQEPQSTNSLSPSMRPPPEKKFKPA
jgi:hypothetical protein